MWYHVVTIGKAWLGSVLPCVVEGGLYDVGDV